MVYFFEDVNGTFIPTLPYIANLGGFPSTTALLPGIGATNVFSRFAFKPNPSDYPFDSQDLEIAFEDASGAALSDLEYYWLPSMSGVSGDIRLRGWSWDSKTTGTSKTHVRTYFGDHQVSQFSWFFTIKRAKIVAVQVLLPPFFVLVSVFISFIMPITASITRIGIVGSALISEVSLHSGFKNANGTAGSLGLIDYFFILTYAILVISLGINVLVMILLRKNDKSPLAIYLERKTKYFVWLVCPGLYTFIFFRGKQVWAAVLCLVTPVVLFAIVERIMPRLRAFRRKHKVTERKKKEDAAATVFGEEEMEAKLQEGEGVDALAQDTKSVVVNKEVLTANRVKQHQTEHSDSLSANLYDTDSE